MLVRSGSCNDSGPRAHGSNKSHVAALPLDGGVTCDFLLRLLCSGSMAGADVACRLDPRAVKLLENARSKLAMPSNC
uniref:Uncharacterized protein n=1 Tax=Oryza meridionalis TaxID=40149 RepID=A0A0E0CFM4_9ORYZ